MDALRDLVKAKVDGQEIVVMEEEEKPVVDIMTALKASIEQAKSAKKPMKKATGKAKAAKTASSSKAKSAKASAPRSRKKKTG